MNVTQNINDFLKSYGGEILSFLDQLSPEDVSSACVYLGVDEGLAWGVIGFLKDYLNGNITKENLISKLLPLGVLFFGKRLLNKQKSSCKTENVSNKNEEKTAYSPTFNKKNPATEILTPIADNDIFYSLECYLND